MLRGILWILWVAGVVAPVVAAGDHAEKKGTESPDDACVARVNRRFAASPVESITHALLGWGQHLEFLPGSKDMVALHADGNLSVYKPDGSVVKKIEIGSLPDSFHGLALSGDGKLAAVSHSEGIRRQSVRILDLQSGREKTSFVLPGDLHTMGLNFSRDGKYLACGSSPAVGVQPALYFVYDTAAGKPIPLDLNGAVPSNLSTSIEFSPDGRFVYAAGGGGELLRWTRPFDGKPQVVATVGGQTPPPLRRFRLTPDGKRVIAVDGGRTIRMVDLSDGKEKMVVSADEGSYFMGISVSPDGGAVAAVSVDRVTVYDLARGKKIATLKPTVPVHDNPGNAISWSSDGATLAMAHTRQIARWDLNEGNKPLVGAVTFGTIWSELARADLGARRGPALAECYGERFYRWAKDELEGKHAKPPSPEIVRQVGTLVTKALAKEPEDLVAFLGTSEASARQAALPAVAAALANGLDSDNFFTREAASAAVEAAAGALANDPERGQLLREIHRVARKLESLEARRRTERLARALGTSLEENASASHQRGALMQVLEGIDKPGPEATALLDYLRKTGG